MIKFSNFSFNKLLAGLVALSIIFSFLAIAAPAVLAEDEIILTIKGDGVEKTVQLTAAQYEALPHENHDYSGYNFYPSLQIFKDTTGVTLQTLLDLAGGIKDEATMIKIKGADMSYSYHTRRDLLDEPRYYFPQGEDGSDCSVWPPEGRGWEGAVEVPTMIADMKNGKLIYGQWDPLEPTACNGEQFSPILTGGTIEVTCEEPTQWDTPVAYPDSGSVIPGTEVELQYGDGSLWHTKIYYTLDGSEPTVHSNIYNISYPTFRPWFNKPIPIDGPVTIKARAVGLGKLDSDVITFNYDLGSLACTVQGAGIDTEYTVETLKGMAPAQGTYQCMDNGQSVSVNATGVLLSTLLDDLGAASNWEVNFIAVNGDKVAGGTVQDARDQQCMLTYDVNGAEVSDVWGDETASIRILRNLSGNSNLNCLKYVNAIELVNVDDEITISDVQLLDYNGSSITSVAPGGGYCIEVDTVNAVNAAKNALLIIQVRCGTDAGMMGGGQVIACTAAQTVVDVNGGKLRAEFSLPEDINGTAYVDVFVWDNFKNNHPLGSGDHTLNFNIQ